MHVRIQYVRKCMDVSDPVEEVNKGSSLGPLAHSHFSAIPERTQVKSSQVSIVEIKNV
jgi:hypothetical protein